ncbi:MAG TPA: TlpA disulfide reductase family protein [Malonomonas sp.]
MSVCKWITLSFFGILLSLPLSAAALQKAETFPELTGETLTGAEFDLASLKGEPILLKVGTSWCGTCREQTKSISKLSDFMTENGIRYVDVFVQESQATVEKYFKKNNYQLPEIVLLDRGAIAKKLNIYLIPRIILIDKNFKVYRDGDTISEKSLKKELQQMLAAEQ